MKNELPNYNKKVGGYVVFNKDGKTAITNDGTKGGYFYGDSHQDPSNGISAIVDNDRPILVEGNEVIINKKTVQSEKVLTVKGTPKEILSTLNQMDGNGVAIGDEEAEILAKYRRGGRVPKSDKIDLRNKEKNTIFDLTKNDKKDETSKQTKSDLIKTISNYVRGNEGASEEGYRKNFSKQEEERLLIDFINDQFPQNVLAPLLKLKVVYPSLFSGLNAFFDVVTNNEDLTLIACAMVDGLQGDNQNTYVNFKGSLTATDGSVASLVSAANQVKNNFVLFNEALEMAYHEDLSEYTCPCGIGTDCEEPLDLIIHAGRGVSITHVSGTLYHFVGDPSVGETGGMYVEDSLGRCMDWWNSDDEEHPTQTVPYHAVTGCCGTPDSEGLIGGFAGLTEGTKFFTLVYWDQQSEPVDTYYNVKCKDTSLCD